MADQQKNKIGDGQDNYAGAAKQMANAAKEASKTAAKATAAEGAKATANAAAATVKAGEEGGKAVAEIAAGTAAGGPWGAIIAAAWSMRHTLFKILVCICLCLVFLITMIVSLPSIIMDYIFGSDSVPPTEGATITSTYDELATDVSAVIQIGYDTSMAEVESIISGGGYDYDLSMEALINHAQSTAGFDTCYILAAYSASMEQKNTDKADMTHAGFRYEAPEENRDYLWDREHYLYDENIPKDVVLIHGHTSARYVMGSGVKGEYLKCENFSGRKALYSYNKGHKIDIDCGTAISKFIALYCLDDEKVYGFQDTGGE